MQRDKLCNMFATRKYTFFWVILIMMIIYEKIEAHPPPEPSSYIQQLQPLQHQQQQQQQQQQQHNVRSFRNALNQQGIQSLLQSIENRLSNLDQIYSHRYSQRVDLNADQLARKIEMLESKLTRLESSLDVQLVKLSENLSSKNFRDDIAKDQIFRKVDSIYERFNHKLTNVEEKIEMAFFKIQNRIEMGMTKIERLDDSINVRHADMESEISEGVQIAKEVKSNVNTLEEKIMNMTRVSTQNLEKIDVINTNVAKTLLNIENTVVNISSQNPEEYNMNFTKKGPSYNYSTKINNMYNEIWRKINIIENDIKNSVDLMNLTREEIQDIKQKTTHSNNQNDDTLDIILDSFKNILQKKFADLGRKMEDNFKNIIATQNLFLESCKSIQMDETQLEKKISSDLEKLLDSLSRRNLVSFKELQNTEEVIKTQSNNMERLIHQNTNTIMKLSEKTSDDRKKIEKILSIVKKDFANFMTMIEHETNLGSLERSEIGNLILELQAQVNDLDKKMNKDNMNYNAKQIQTLQVDDVLKQTKDIFAKQLNTSTIHNTIKRVDDSVKDIHKLLYDIYIKINKCSHLHKLNATQINFDYNDDTETKPPNESVDIVFGESDKNINLFRYNYSVIDDKKHHDIPAAITISPINSTNVNNNLFRYNYPVIGDNKHDDIPAPITIAPMNLTNINNNHNNNDDDEDEIIQFSSEEEHLTKDENISLEKPYDGENKNKPNSTNNIISIDNKSESLITNIPPSDSEAISNNESNESGIDIIEELYSKFFGTKNMDEIDATSEISDSIPTTTTELTDNTDYEDDNFYD